MKPEGESPEGGGGSCKDGSLRCIEMGHVGWGEQNEENQEAGREEGPSWRFGDQVEDKR